MIVDGAGMRAAHETLRDGGVEPEQLGDEADAPLLPRSTERAPDGEVGGAGVGEGDESRQRAFGVPAREACEEQLRGPLEGLTAGVERRVGRRTERAEHGVRFGPVVGTEAHEGRLDERVGCHGIEDGVHVEPRGADVRRFAFVDGIAHLDDPLTQGRELSFEGVAIGERGGACSTGFVDAHGEQREGVWIAADAVRLESLLKLRAVFEAAQPTVGTGEERVLVVADEPVREQSVEGDHGARRLEVRDFSPMEQEQRLHEELDLADTPAIMFHIDPARVGVRRGASGSSREGSGLLEHGGADRASVDEWTERSQELVP